MSTPFRLQVPRRFVDEMVAHARAELPNECVGLLAGRLPAAPSKEGEEPPLVRAERRYPLVNAAATRPREYVSEPKSMFAAMKDMWARDMDVVAVYHSHPTSEPVPSRTDLEWNYAPGVVNFIVSMLGPEPDLRGWWLTDRDYRPAEWETVD